MRGSEPNVHADPGPNAHADDTLLRPHDSAVEAMTMVDTMQCRSLRQFCPAQVARCHRVLVGALGLISALLVVGSRAPARAQACSPCIGDCNFDRQVAVSELVLLVDIALGAKPVSECPSGDENDNRSIEVNEL